MTHHDPAFLWETEAMRDSPQRVAEFEHDAAEKPVDPDRWVTLRQASRATGIPVETLRKWGRRSSVPSYLSPSPDGGSSIRMIDLEGVRRRAAELGRPTTDPGGEPPQHEEPRQEQASPPAEPAETPPGTMIVPIDAWNKMLNQLGNLHQAGQQLAEARERAAKAETEAAFLRERLAEFRRTKTDLAPPVQPPDPEPAPAASPPQPPEKVWQYLVRRIRDR